MMHPLLRLIKKAAYYLPRRFGTFAFGTRRLAYYCHAYNHTWLNERCIEIPLALDFLRPGMRVLEVGRVLDHYRPFPHDCVDKFEPGAVNVDVVDYKPSENYDLILSISTLEHVGWDEDRNREKIHVAIRHLRSLLKPGGVLVATLPTGYNQNLDEDLRGGQSFSRNSIILPAPLWAVGKKPLP